MTVQSTYSENLAIGLAGQIASGYNNSIASAIVATEAGAEFGSVMVAGANEGEVIVPTAGGTFAGILVRDQSADPVGANKILEGGNASLLTKGEIFVKVSAQVTHDTQAYFTSTGAITGSSGGNTAIVGGFFKTDAAQDGIAKLRIS